ncbi:MAG TPA: hypothetical protein VFX09_09200 [Burkholderiales bacterium]|nr:hypothetical protein [Burkholderiales bacterium]
MTAPGMDGRSPGRDCPLSYGYGAKALAGDPVLAVDSLWVAGGLYGNPFALRQLMELYEREPGRKALVFNGDFHWFDIEPAVFLEIERHTADHRSTRGNVETELASPAQGTGCGCGYPEWINDEAVARSNGIMERLKRTARAFPRARERLGALPMHLVAAVGGERIAVVHGDGDSLAGWGFSQEVLATRAGCEAALRSFEGAGVRVFASSHTCLPVLQRLDDERGERVIANNGAAGMPNFSGTHFGLATRISLRPGVGAIHAQRAGPLHVEAVPLHYDVRAWRECFLAQWPPGSEAHRAYFARIEHGPRYAPVQALRAASARLAA